MNLPVIKNMQMLFSSNEFIVFDLETTGYSRNTERIIECAAIKFKLNINPITNHVEFEELGKIDVYIRPPVPVSKKIEELTGITNEFLADKPTEDKVFPVIQRFFENTLVVGHNVSFDVGFMQKMYDRHYAKFEPIAIIDTLQISRSVIAPGATENYKLSTIAQYCKVDKGVKFHNALGDATVTKRIFYIFVRRYMSCKVKK